MDVVIFDILEAWPPEGHALAISVIETEKFALHKREEETKLRMA